MGVENGIFWSEFGSGFGDAGGTPPPKVQGVPRLPQIKAKKLPSTGCCDWIFSLPKFTNLLHYQMTINIKMNQIIFQSILAISCFFFQASEKLNFQ